MSVQQFKHRPRPIQAVYFDGTPESGREIVDWLKEFDIDLTYIGDRTIFESKPSHNPGPKDTPKIVINEAPGMSRWIEVFSGRWISRDQDGFIRGYLPEEMHELFKVIEPKEPQTKVEVNIQNAETNRRRRLGI